MNAAKMKKSLPLPAQTMVRSQPVGQIIPQQIAPRPIAPAMPLRPVQAPIQPSGGPLQTTMPSSGPLQASRPVAQVQVAPQTQQFMQQRALGSILPQNSGAPQDPRLLAQALLKRR